MSKVDGEFARNEVSSIYVEASERFVVSLIVGYDDDTNLAENIGDWDEMTPEEQARAAAASALDLTRDDGSNGTIWFVFDRKTKTMHQFEQGEFEEIDVP